MIKESLSALFIELAKFLSRFGHFAEWTRLNVECLQLGFLLSLFEVLLSYKTSKINGHADQGAVAEYLVPRLHICQQL